MPSRAASLLLAVAVVGACAGTPAPPADGRAAASGTTSRDARDARDAQSDAEVAAASRAELEAAAEAPVVDASSAAPALAFDATVPEGRKLRVFDLGRAACNPAPAIRRFLSANEGCAALKVKNARSTGDTKGRPSLAFDGDACTIWNAGAHPVQAIEAELEGEGHVAAILVIPEMTPAKGRAVHVVELALQGSKTTRRVAFDATLTSNDGYLVVMDGSPAADRVRLVTAESASWVAWREIVIFRCSGRAHIPPGLTEVTPSPSRRIIAGKGACKVDADCAEDSCCGAHTCLARSLAPRCDGVGCGQGCGGDNMACGRASCVCERGTCAAWYHGVDRGQQ